ncbi:MAG TPA: phosphoribosyltransferase [Terriglobales bacterium]
MLFRDRYDAGQQLAARLQHYAGDPDAILLALPRGGIPVAYEVARSLHIPMDVFIVRKIGVPGHEELAMGAISSGGVRVLNKAVVEQLAIPESMIESVARREEDELHRREQLYRGNLPFPDLRGKTAILVDDGLATGATMRVAATAVRSKWARRIVVAVPVASEASCAELEDEVDETICAAMPASFFAVGQWYEDFRPTSDQEVRELLMRAVKDLPMAG